MPKTLKELLLLLEITKQNNREIKQVISDFKSEVKRAKKIDTLLENIKDAH